MKTIQERIILLIELLDLSTNAFAKGIEVQPTVIYNIIKGRNNPSYEVINKIIIRYSVNPTWLFLEEGDVLRSKKTRDTLSNESYDIIQSPKEPIDNEFIEGLIELEERKAQNAPDEEKIIQYIFNCYNQKTNAKIEHDSFRDLEMKFELLTEISHQIQEKLNLDIIGQVNEQDRDSIIKEGVEKISDELIAIIDKYKNIYYNLHQYQKELNSITGTLITTVDAMAVIRRRLEEKGEVRIGFSS